MQPQESAEDTHSLQVEIQFYKQNHQLLAEEIKKLIEDNTKLSKQVENLLREKLEATSISHCNIKEHDNLYKQVALLVKERDSIIGLWQTSQSTIEALESELKTYQNEYFNSPYSRQIDKINHESGDKKFISALEQIEELENKLQAAKKRENILENDVKDRDEIIAKERKKLKELQDEIREIQKDLEECKVQKANNDRIIDDLKKQLEINNVELNISRAKETEAKQKVQEALCLLDIAIAEKDDSTTKAFAAAEELNILKLNAGEVASDIEKRLRAELDQVKERYEEKIADMLQHIQTLDAELVERGLQLATLARENKVLKRANDTFEKLKADIVDTVDPRLSVAEKKVQAAFKELVLTERRNVRLLSENRSAVAERQRERDSHQREMKRMRWENSLLKSQLDDCRLQVEHLRKSLEDADAMVEKLQKLSSSKNFCSLRSRELPAEKLDKLNVQSE